MIPFQRPDRVGPVARDEAPPPKRSPHTCAGAGPAGICIFQSWGGEWGLSPAACERMAPLWRTNQYHRGDVIFYQGNAPVSVFFLCSGSVKLVRNARMGRQHILRMVTGPDFLGERALLAGQPYAASAQVMEDSRVCTIEGESFRALWRSEPELPRMLASYLACKLAEADEAACDLALRTLRELLARLIVGRLAPRGDGIVHFSESRQDLADILGTSAEVVSRTLSEFERKKLVMRDGRNLRILDEERMRAIGGLPALRPDFYQSAACVPPVRSSPAERAIRAVTESNKAAKDLRPTKTVASAVITQELAKPSRRTSAPKSKTRKYRSR